MKFHRRGLAPLLALAVWLGGCATTRQQTTTLNLGGARTLPLEIHWVRNSAEYHAVTTELYRLAEAKIRVAASGRAAGTWAVILDADETVLDNSEYQRRIALAGSSYSNESWYAWARERAAGIVPGALPFLTAVDQLGGRIAIVTNRDEVVCEDTRENLRRLGVAADVVLCRNGVSDKNPRFQSVSAGTARADLPAAEVLMWIGDNIEDFPELNQGIRGQGESAYLPFGDRYILVPNPMYGSWVDNPRQ